jgi:hypothetical protein
MRLEEVVQYVQQGLGMFSVCTQLGSPNIVNDHVPDLLARALPAQYIGDRCRGNLR